METETVLVVGQGEVGKPMAEILSSVYRVVTKDIDPLNLSEPVGVMHICYPYRGADFVGTTIDYISQYGPALTVIHTTVPPGTTRAVEYRSHQPVAYSAVRGKHSAMVKDILSFTKYVSAIKQEPLQQATDHLSRAGMRVKSFSSPEALELAKLQETTYFGLLIAWAQEVERYCKKLGLDYNEVMQLTEEVDYLPSVIFQPGFIGGHCVMPNIELLETIRPSPFLEVIKQSNAIKAREWLEAGRRLEERLIPKASKAG